MAFHRGFLQGHGGQSLLRLGIGPGAPHMFDTFVNSPIALPPPLLEMVEEALCVPEVVPKSNKVEVRDTGRGTVRRGNRSGGAHGRGVGKEKATKEVAAAQQELAELKEEATAGTSYYDADPGSVVAEARALLGTFTQPFLDPFPCLSRNFL